MRWSTRVLLSSLAAVLVPLIVLAFVGLPAISSHLSQSTEANLQRWTRATATLVATALDDLQREARLLARDPAVVQGVVKGDWGILARGASPRMLSLTLERVADLVLIVGEQGAPLVQVPAAQVPPAVGLPLGSAATSTVQLVSGTPMLLGAVPIVKDGRALGTVVVGRKFDGVARRLADDASRIELVVLASGAPAYTTLREGVSGVHWAEATRVGRLEVRGASYLVRPVSRWPEVGLWLLVPDDELRATQGVVSTWIVGFLLFAGCAMFVASWILTRRVLRPIEAIGEGARRVAAGDFDTRIPPGPDKGLDDMARAFNEMGVYLQRWRREVEHRNRELEALNALAFTLNRSVDLVPTVEETLEVVRRVTEMEVAALCRADEGGQTLSLIAQRGLAPEVVESYRVLPLQGSPFEQAVKTGRPAIVRGFPGPPSAQARRYATQIALPIPVKGEIWGVMLLATSTPRDFTAEDTQLMEAVGYQVGAAVERTSLFAEIREKGQRLESLVGVARTVTARLNLDEVLEAVVQAASGLVPDSSVRLWVTEEDRLVLRRASGVGASTFGGRKTTFAVGEGLAGHVAQTGEPLIVERVLEDPRTVNVEWMSQEGYVSFAGVPLLFQNRVLGVLAILTRRLTRFTKEDLELLMSFATQTAIAMENARLYADASRSAAEHQALLEVAGLTGSTLKVERVLDTIVERARALLKVRAAGIFRVDEAADLLVYERGIGLSPEFIRSLHVRPGEGTSGKALQYRAPAWSSDLLNDPTVTLSDEARTLVEREGYRAVLSVPILVKGKPYGVLAVYWWEQYSPAFSEVHLLSALASQAAVALDNAQLYEAATRRGKRLETLAQLTETLTATLRVEEVLDRVVSSAVELFGSSVSRLWLVDEGGETLSLRAHSGSISKDPGLTRLRVGEGLAGWIVAAKAPLVVLDLAADPRPVNRERLAAEGAVSYAGAPMLLGDRVLGALGIALRERRGFSEEEVSLLQSLANHAAIALENARLYQAAARRAARMRALAEMGQLLVSTFDRDLILETLATRCRESLDISDLGIFFLNDGNSELCFFHGFGSRKAFWRTHRLRIGEGVSGRAVAENRPVWTENLLADPGITLRPETRASIEAVGGRAVFAVPLSGARPFGALVVHREPGYQFTAEEREFLTTFANQVAVALENARLYAEIRERLRETETLLAVGRVLSCNLPPEEAMRQVAREVGHAFQADMVGAYFLNAQKEVLVPLAGYHVPKHLFRVFLDSPFPVSRFPFLQEAWETRKPVWTSDAMNDLRFDQGFLGEIRPGAVLFAPTLVRGEIVGGLFLVWWTPGRTFTSAELRLVEGVASQVGLALENVDLMRQRQEKLQEAETLLRVSRALSTTLELEPLLRHFLREVARVIDADSVGVWLVDATTGWLAPFAGHRVPPHLLERIRRAHINPAESPFYAEAIASRRVVVSSNVPDDPRIPDGQKSAVPHRAQLFAPIVVKDQVIGAFMAVWWDRTREFSQRELALVETMGNQAGVAIENARLFDERTRALQELATAQDQLIRTEKLRALGEMASGVAHDFNNLLASILGRAQLLLRKVEDPKFRQWLQVIERAATDGARTVRRIQEFARVRRDQPFVPVDVNRVVREALEVTQSRWAEEAQSQSVTIEVVSALEPVPEIAGDPVELREALTNLILNAVDAMPDGGTLALSTRVGNGEVVVQVSDTGVGISEEIQRQIFDPFFTTKGPKGTGLGLSLTYGIVSRHGGQISVESAEGRGATFTLTFPISRAEPQRPSPPSLPASAPLRCLVVDDDQMVLEALGDLLVMAGHSAVLVSNGAAAIARFKAEPFDLVLTDLAMPRMNGWQLARAVKDHDPSVPVLLVTGLGVELSPEELHVHGVDAVLAKPVKLEDVLAAVASFGSRGQRERPASTKDAS